MRSDLSAVCLDCRVRFSRAGRCPRCKHEATFDLCDDGAAKKLRARFRRRWKRGRRSRPGLYQRWWEADRRAWNRLSAYASRHGETLLLRLTGLGFVAGGAFGMWMDGFWAFIAGGLLGAAVPVSVVVAAFPTLTAAFYAVGLPLALIDGARFVIRRAQVRLGRPPTLKLDVISEIDPQPDEERTALQGRVCCSQSLTSPLAGTPCIAFRLVGHSRGGAIDDADMVSFVIEAAGRVVASVAAQPCSIAIEQGAPRPHPTNPALSSFLEGRAIDPSGLHLAEALICEGDEVLLEGLVDTAPLSYRDGQSMVAYRDDPASPLVIRLLR